MKRENEMLNDNSLLTTVIFTSTVFAALLTSLMNLFISLINNRRLNVIETQKKINEIDKYRYSRLYEVMLNWHNYDFKIEGNDLDETILLRLMMNFIDDSQRYDFIRPLLDQKFIDLLDEKKEKGYSLLYELYIIRTTDNHRKDFMAIKEEYLHNSTEFRNQLIECITQQLNLLLNET